MHKAIEEHCTIASEDGEVILECGHAVVSLTPNVAHQAADRLHEHADLAIAQVPKPDA